MGQNESYLQSQRNMRAIKRFEHGGISKRVLKANRSVSRATMKQSKEGQIEPIES